MASEHPVRVRRSARRTKTVSARLVNGVLEVSVPGWMTAADEARWVDEMVRRHHRRNRTEGIDLLGRATAVAERYELPRPREARWVEMTTRWGSCTPSSRSIRVSTRVAAFPPWVLDYVLVHELAHLAVADHSPAFWRVVHRYPKVERAIGYLIARSSSDDEPLDADGPDL